MKDHLLQHGTRETPQVEAMRGDQVANSAGGFVWQVDAWTRLRRFLILGTEGGSYYAAERDLTKRSVESLRECIAADGPRTVAEIVAVSHGGLAAKNDGALYALAACISLGDQATKRAAAEALPSVARIATHLYHFVAYAETMRGWGRTMRWAVSNWYRKNPDQLALQAVKYRQRDGWSHRDLLRLAHPASRYDKTEAALFNWITHGTLGDDVVPHKGKPALNLIVGYERAQASKSASETARIVLEYKLPREALLTEHLTDPDVWRALLDVGMPIHALTRNLANMTRIGVLEGAYKQLVVEALGDQEKIKASRLHPMAILVALSTYSSGRGRLGANTWAPKPDVTDALDAAFYLAFDNVIPTGKRHLLALDVSPSMTHGAVAGSNLSPRAASVAMALVTLHAEPDTQVVAFAGDKLEPLGLSRRQRLDDAVRSVSGINWSHTDCALPMLDSLARRDGTEAFVVYTDSETFHGTVHPKQALDRYREQTGIQARSAVVGMVANDFTIADPEDSGMMDFVGFDASAPALMSEFLAGRV